MAYYKLLKENYSYSHLINEENVKDYLGRNSVISLTTNCRSHENMIKQNNFYVFRFVKKVNFEKHKANRV